MAVNLTASNSGEGQMRLGMLGNVARRTWRALQRRAREFSPTMARDLMRLRILEGALARYRPGSIRIRGMEWQYADFASFASQFRAIFSADQYAFHAEDVHRSPRIIDCGANIGMAAIMFARRSPGARITCFEPDPVLFRTLGTNLSRAGILDRVERVNAAIWGQPAGEIDFAPDGADGGFADKNGKVRVKAVRLGPYLREPIGLLKLDIEGAEIEVLRDIRIELRHVRQLIMEFHCVVGMPQRLGESLAILEESGFRVAVNAAAGWSNPLIREVPASRFDELFIVYGQRHCQTPWHAEPVIPLGGP